METTIKEGSEKQNGGSDELHKKLETKIAEISQVVTHEIEERNVIFNQFQNNFENYIRNTNSLSMHDKNHSDYHLKNDALLESIKENNINLVSKSYREILNKEELERGKLELNLRTEIGSFTYQIRKEIEIFKEQNSNLTGKLTEMIKLEVDSRMGSEKENRQLMEIIIKDILNDVKYFKDSFAIRNDKLLHSLKEVGEESSQRANCLSKYIDSEVKKIKDNFI